MKLIIDIPDDAYKKIIADKNVIYDRMYYSIKNGIPLKDEVMIATLMSLVTDKDYKPNLEGENE